MTYYANRYSTHPSYPSYSQQAPQWKPVISTKPGPDEPDFVPFIPDLGPSSDLYKLKPYTWRASKGAWKHIKDSGVAFDTERDRLTEYKRGPPASQVRIVTWNVDFSSPHPEERLNAALRHIEDEVLQKKGEEDEPEPSVILLQEVASTAFHIITSDSWVRSHFAVLPLTRESWPQGAGYGNVTLVSRSLHIAECHILHYGPSTMQRTAICVKVKLQHPTPSKEKAVIAIVNTHLESLPKGEMDRPRQLELCTRFLKLEGVNGGVVAGDMNAIGAEDALLPKENGLRDAWRKAESDAGNTWGYQGQNQGGFPCNRLDKILFLPGMGYKVEEPTRVGVGLKVREDAPGGALWVSDHYGLTTTLRMLRPRAASN